MRCLFALFPLLLAAQPPVDKGRLLLESIHKGDFTAVRAALKSGADANAHDNLGATALMHAAAYARSTPCGPWSPPVPTLTPSAMPALLP